jgi:hypothetical protein
MAYLDPKGEGDQSMPGKQWSRPGVRDEVLRDPRNMARAGLPEAKSPEMQAAIHRKDARTGAVPCAGVPLSPAQPSGHRTMPNEGIEGDELAAYVPLDTCNKDERGIAYGTRVLWRRRPRSSRRSHDLPRRPGEPDTGRRGPGDRASTVPGGRRNAKRRTGS